MYFFTTVIKYNLCDLNVMYILTLYIIYFIYLFKNVINEAPGTSNASGN